MLLEVKNLRLELENKQCLFENVSFKFDTDTMGEKKVLAIRGPSGSGKTTLLKCLAELIPYEGEIYLNGK